MAEASLLFVRDDRGVADKLARALEANGVTICASVSALEEGAEYDAVVALFSGTAVKSPLLMERALAAEHEGKLVPVFVGLCHLQPPLNKLVFHDLCEWQGDVNDVALQAIRAHVMRIARARATGELLRAGMRSPEPEPEPPVPPPPDLGLARRQEDEARRAQQKLDQEETLARLERERQERAAARAQEDAVLRQRAADEARARQEAVLRQQAAEDARIQQEARQGRRASPVTQEQSARRAPGPSAVEAAPRAPVPDSLEERQRKEREHRARELAARQAARGDDFMRPGDLGRDAPHDDRDIGDPFAAPRRTSRAADEIDTAPQRRRRGFGVSDWASDVLVMTLVAVGGIAAIVIAAQPEAAQAVANGLNAEVAALLQSLGQ